MYCSKNLREKSEKTISTRSFETMKTHLHKKVKKIRSLFSPDKGTKASSYYRLIFEHSMAALWEEDFTGVCKELKSLEEGGVEDFRSYFREKPQEVCRIFDMVEVINVNPAAVSLLRAQTPGELIGPLKTVINDNTLPFLTEELIAVAEGRPHIEGETVNTAFDGEEIHVLVGMTIPREGQDLEHVLVSMMDISERKRRERDRDTLLTQLQEEKLLSETLREVTLALTGITEQSRLLDTILEQAGRIVPYASANIRLIENEKLYVSRWAGYEAYGAQEFIAQFVKEVKAYPILQKSLETGEPAIFPDTKSEKRWTTYPETEYINSAILIPIFGNEKTYGVRIALLMYSVSG